MSTNRVIAVEGAARPAAPKRAGGRRRATPRPEGRGRPLFVTSSHLAVSYPELSGFEFGLIVAWHAFERWMLRCMATARGGQRDLAPLDVLVLHHAHHRHTAKRIADICFVLDVEDTHVVTYSLKKLSAAGLVRGERRGKEVYFSTTAAGAALCARYKEVRDACLVAGFGGAPDEAERLAGVAQFLRGQAAAYDQASRTAAVSLGAPPPGARRAGRRDGADEVGDRRRPAAAAPRGSGRARTARAGKRR